MVKALEELADALSKLPTIGKKSAWRLAMYILERDREQANHLSSCIASIKDRVVTCSRCFNYAETDPCPTCQSNSRDHSTICVVEKPVDVLTIERSGRFRGLYHVLGGVLSPINGVTADKLHIAALEKRSREEAPKEIILALGGSAEAETTALFLVKLLSTSGARITRLARGLPAGMELEYVDQITLNQALNERTDIRYGE